MKNWMTRIVMSQPFKVIATEAAELFIETVATAVANSIIDERKERKEKNNLTLIKNKENDNVQLHSELKRSEQPTRENSGLRLASD